MKFENLLIMCLAVEEDTSLCKRSRRSEYSIFINMQSPKEICASMDAVNSLTSGGDVNELKKRKREDSDEDMSRKHRRLCQLLIETPSTIQLNFPKKINSENCDLCDGLRIQWSSGVSLILSLLNKGVNLCPHRFLQQYHNEKSKSSVMDNLAEIKSLIPLQTGIKTIDQHRKRSHTKKNSLRKNLQSGIDFWMREIQKEDTAYSMDTIVKNHAMWKDCLSHCI